MQVSSQPKHGGLDYFTYMCICSLKSTNQSEYEVLIYVMQNQAHHMANFLKQTNENLVVGHCATL